MNCPTEASPQLNQFWWWLSKGKEKWKGGEILEACSSQSLHQGGKTVPTSHSGKSYPMKLKLLPFTINQFSCN
jgi:hypothetical protein